MTTRTGWTGGQYSIYRALLALLIGPRLIAGFAGTAPPLLGATLAVATLFGMLALASGWRDRWAAVALGGLGVLMSRMGDFAGPSLARADMLSLGLLLALHIGAPPAPFGARDAHSRTDPGGEWRMPAWIWHTAWLSLGLSHGLAAAFAVEAWLAGPATSGTIGLGIVTWALEIGVVVAVFRPGLRRATWSAIMLWQIAWTSAFGETASSPGFWLLHLLAFDPGWIPARSWLVATPCPNDRVASPEVPRLFYDGDCGFCHSSIRFILAEEAVTPDPMRLHFAPLDSSVFEELIERHGLQRDTLPDSLVLELEDGSLQTRSAAALEIASRLGGLWRVLSILLRWMPRGMLDQGYDAVARVRKRLFARPKESCPLIPPQMRNRFRF